MKRGRLYHQGEQVARVHRHLPAALWTRRHRKPQLDYRLNLSPFFLKKTYFGFVNEHLKSHTNDCEAVLFYDLVFFFPFSEPYWSIFQKFGVLLDHHSFLFCSDALLNRLQVFTEKN